MEASWGVIPCPVSYKVDCRLDSEWQIFNFFIDKTKSYVNLNQFFHFPFFFAVGDAGEMEGNIYIFISLQAK